MGLYKDFQKSFRTFFTEASCKPGKTAVEFLEKAKPAAGENSQFGRMVGEFLQLR